MENPAQLSFGGSSLKGSFTRDDFFNKPQDEFAADWPRTSEHSLVFERRNFQQDCGVFVRQELNRFAALERTKFASKKHSSITGQAAPAPSVHEEHVDSLVLQTPLGLQRSEEHVDSLVLRRSEEHVDSLVLLQPQELHVDSLVLRRSEEHVDSLVLQPPQELHVDSLVLPRPPAATVPRSSKPATQQRKSTRNSTKWRIGGVALPASAQPAVAEWARIFQAKRHERGTGTYGFVSTASHNFGVSNIDTVELGEQVGQGGQGAVFIGSVTVKTSGGGNKSCPVAMKLARVDGTRHMQSERSLVVESEMLHKLRGCPGVVRVVGNSGKPIAVNFNEDYNEVCLPLRQASVSLGSLVRSKAFCKATYTQKVTFVRAVFLEVLRSLDQMHSRFAIIHRDIKPDNILITFHKHGNVEVNICDFGLARSCSPRDEPLVELCGTRGYVAPEVMRTASNAHCKPYTSKADLFSLGVSMFYCLTGGMFPERVGSVKTRSKGIRATSDEHSDHDFAVPVAQHLDSQTSTFIQSLLLENPNARLTARDALGRAYWNDSSFKSCLRRECQ